MQNHFKNQQGFTIISAFLLVFFILFSYLVYDFITFSINRNREAQETQNSDELQNTQLTNDGSPRPSVIIEPAPSGFSPKTQNFKNFTFTLPAFLRTDSSFPDNKYIKHYLSEDLYISASCELGTFPTIEECEQLRRKNASYEFEVFESVSDIQNLDLLFEHTSQNGTQWKIYNANVSEVIPQRVSYYATSDLISPAAFYFGYYPNTVGYKHFFEGDKPILPLDYLKQILDSVVVKNLDDFKFPQQILQAVSTPIGFSVISASNVSRFLTGPSSTNNIIFTNNNFTYETSGQFAEGNKSFSCVPKNNVVQNLNNVLTLNNLKVIYKEDFDQINKETRENPIDLDLYTFPIQNSASESAQVKLIFENGQDLYLFYNAYGTYSALFCRYNNCVVADQYGDKENDLDNYRPFIYVIETSLLKPYISDVLRIPASLDSICI